VLGGQIKTGASGQACLPPSPNATDPEQGAAQGPSCPPPDVGVHQSVLPDAPAPQPNTCGGEQELECPPTPSKKPVTKSVTARTLAGRFATPEPIVRRQLLDEIKLRRAEKDFEHVVTLCDEHLKRHPMDEGVVQERFDARKALMDGTKMSAKQRAPLERAQRADEALLTAMHGDAEKEALEANRDNAAVDWLAEGKRFFALAGQRFPNRGQTTLVRDKLNDLAAVAFRNAQRTARDSDQRTLCHGYELMAQGRVDVARELLEPIRHQVPEANALVQGVDLDRLRAFNFKALGVWSAYLEEGERIQRSQATGGGGHAKGTLDASTRSDKRTLHHDEAAYWVEQRALFSEVGKRIEQGKAATINDALQQILERGTEQQRAAALKLFDHPLMRNVIFYADRMPPSHSAAVGILNFGMELEAKANAAEFPYAAYALVRGNSPERDVRERAAGGMRALQGDSSPGRAISKFIQGFDGLELAFDALTLQLGKKMVLKAAAGATRVARTAGVGGRAAASIGTAAYYGADTAMLGTFFWGKELFKQDVSKSFEAKHIAKTYGAALVMGVLGGAGGAGGGALGTRAAVRKGLVREGTSVLTREGQELAGRYAAGGAAVGVMGTGPLLRGTGLNEKPVGGETEGIVNDIGGYVAFALTGRALGAASSGRTVRIGQREHQRFEMEKARSRALGYAERLERQQQLNEARAEEAPNGEQAVAPAKRHVVAGHLMEGELNHPGFSGRKVVKMIEAGRYEDANRYLEAHAMRLRVGEDGRMTLPRPRAASDVAANDNAPAARGTQSRSSGTLTGLVEPLRLAIDPASYGINGINESPMALTLMLGRPKLKGVPANDNVDPRSRRIDVVDQTETPKQSSKSSPIIVEDRTAQPSQEAAPQGTDSTPARPALAVGFGPSAGQLELSRRILFGRGRSATAQAPEQPQLQLELGAAGMFPSEPGAPRPAGLGSKLRLEMAPSRTSDESPRGPVAGEVGAPADARRAEAPATPQVVRGEGRAAKDITFDERGEVVVGRGPKSELEVAGPKEQVVSQRHATIARTQETDEYGRTSTAYWIHDGADGLASKNGTVVQKKDGRTVVVQPHDWTALDHGDKILLGGKNGVPLEWREPQAEAPAGPRAGERGAPAEVVVPKDLPVIRVPETAKPEAFWSRFAAGTPDMRQIMDLIQRGASPEEIARFTRDPERQKIAAFVQGNANPAEALRYLAELPPHKVAPSNDALGGAEPVPHHADAGYQSYLTSLLKKVHAEHVQTGRMTESELWNLARRAKSVDAERVQGLAAMGFREPFNFVEGLKFALETDRQQQARGAIADAGREKLIAGLAGWTQAKFQEGRDYRDSSLLDLMRRYGRHEDGRRVEYPATYRFLWEYFGVDRDGKPSTEVIRQELGTLYKPDSPREMLQKLIQGRDGLRQQWQKDIGKPVLEGGKWVNKPAPKLDTESYNAAVRELARAAETQRPPARSDGLPLPFEGSVPRFESLSASAWRRLSAAENLVELIAYRDSGSPATPGSAMPQGTAHGAYEAGVAGGKRAQTTLSGLRLPRTRLEGEIESEGWLFRDIIEKPAGLRGGQLGRFYFAVRPEHAADFWDAMRGKLDDVKQLPGEQPWRQAKILMDGDDYGKKRGDAGVLYFDGRDPSTQRRYYDIAVSIAKAHPEWFHSENKPMYAAQVLDEQGKPVRGLSFCQNPENSESANWRIAQAMEEVKRNQQLLDILGTPADRGQKLRLMAQALQQRGVDIAHPAFSTALNGLPAGVEIFNWIFRHTDQFEASSPKRP
jgi:hypothetical protein